MTKVFIIHGFEGAPNGGWRPWLMSELALRDAYACALPMPDPRRPEPEAWVSEIARVVARHPGDDIYLVGHSLGVAAIMRYAEGMPETVKIAGAVLVSGRAEPTANPVLARFYEKPFDFAAIKARLGKVVIIHGDDDPVVPFGNAEILSKALAAGLVVIPKGGHLGGSSGWRSLPPCRDALLAMMSGQDVVGTTS